MIRLISNRWVQIILLLLLLGELVVLRLQDPPLVQRWRQLTFDTYNRLIPRPPGHGVVIIDIDEDSLRNYGQWPWPRPLVARIPEVLHDMGAKVIAFDIVFAEADRTSPSLIANNLPQTAEMQPVQVAGSRDSQPAGCRFDSYAAHQSRRPQPCGPAVGAPVVINEPIST